MASREQLIKIGFELGREDETIKDIVNLVKQKSAPVSFELTNAEELRAELGKISKDVPLTIDTKQLSKDIDSLRSTLKGFAADMKQAFSGIPRGGAGNAPVAREKVRLVLSPEEQPATILDESSKIRKQAQAELKKLQSARQKENQEEINAADSQEKVRKNAQSNIDKIKTAKQRELDNQSKQEIREADARSAIQSRAQKEIDRIKDQREKDRIAEEKRQAKEKADAEKKTAAEAASAAATLAAEQKREQRRAFQIEKATKKFEADFVQGEVLQGIGPGGAERRRLLRLRAAEEFAGDRNIPGLLENLQTRVNAGNNPALFSKSRLNNAALQQIALAGIFGVNTGGLAGGLLGAGAATAGGLIKGASGALTASAVQQATFGLLTPMLAAFKSKEEEFKQAGEIYSRSILGISSVLQNASVAVGTNISAQLSVQEKRASDIQTQARAKLLPLGIGGTAEATTVQGIVAALGQRGIQGSPQQIAILAERIAGAVQAQQPQLLDNPARFLRDVEDVFSGGPAANRTTLSQLIRLSIPGFQRATNIEDFIRATEPIKGFAEAVKESNNPAAILQKQQGALDINVTSGGITFFQELLPSMKDFLAFLNDPETKRASEELGKGIGGVASVLQEFTIGIGRLTNEIVVGLADLSEGIGIAISNLTNTTNENTARKLEKAIDESTAATVAANIKAKIVPTVDNALKRIGLEDSVLDFDQARSRRPENRVLALEQALGVLNRAPKAEEVEADLRKPGVIAELGTARREASEEAKNFFAQLAGGRSALSNALGGNAGSNAELRKQEDAAFQKKIDELKKVEKDAGGRPIDVVNAEKALARAERIFKVEERARQAADFAFVTTKEEFDQGEATQSELDDALLEKERAFAQREEARGNVLSAKQVLDTAKAENRSLAESRAVQTLRNEGEERNRARAAQDLNAVKSLLESGPNIFNQSKALGITVDQLDKLNETIKTNQPVAGENVIDANIRQQRLQEAEKQRLAKSSDIDIQQQSLAQTSRDLAAAQSTYNSALKDTQQIIAEENSKRRDLNAQLDSARRALDSFAENLNATAGGKENEIAALAQKITEEGGDAGFLSGISPEQLQSAQLASDVARLNQLTRDVGLGSNIATGGQRLRFINELGAGKFQDEARNDRSKLEDNFRRTQVELDKLPDTFAQGRVKLETEINNLAAVIRKFTDISGVQKFDFSPEGLKARTAEANRLAEEKAAKDKEFAEKTNYEIVNGKPRAKANENSPRNLIIETFDEKGNLVKEKLVVTGGDLSRSELIPFTDTPKGKIPYKKGGGPIEAGATSLRPFGPQGVSYIDEKGFLTTTDFPKLDPNKAGISAENDFSNKLFPYPLFDGPLFDTPSIAPGGQGRKQPDPSRAKDDTSDKVSQLTQKVDQLITAINGIGSRPQLVVFDPASSDDLANKTSMYINGSVGTS